MQKIQREAKKENRKGRRLPLTSMLCGRPASPDEARPGSSSAPTAAAGAGGGSAPTPLQKAAERFWGGVQLGNVPYIIISQQPPPSGK